MPNRAVVALIVTLWILCWSEVGFAQGIRPIYRDSKYTLSLSNRNDVLLLNVPKDEWEAYLSGKYYGQMAPFHFAGETISTSWMVPVFSVFKDSFDFIVMIPNVEKKPIDLMNAFYQHVRNDVTGIGTPYFGTPIFDFTSIYGNNVHRLQGIIYYNHTDDLDTGPILHEFLHRWGNYILNTEPSQAHWGFVDVDGRLGGFSRYDKSTDGQITVHNLNHYFSGPYAPLELYLMGLVPKDEVPPITVLTDLPNYEKQVQVPQYTIKGIPRTYTIDQIIAGVASNANQRKGLGKRIPDYKSSQKAFTVLAVLFDCKDMQASTVDAVSDKIERICSNAINKNGTMSFWEATGGRATLTAGNLLEQRKSP